MKEILSQVIVDDRPAAVVLNSDDTRFEITVNGHVAFLTYRLDPEALSLLHTEVPPALQGKRLGDTLARAALEHARSRNTTVNPSCPFVAKYIGRHPEYSDLVSAKCAPKTVEGPRLPEKK